LGSGGSSPEPDRPRGASSSGGGTATAQFPFILADDLGQHQLGCYGSKYYETPSIDRLAAQGMKFTRAYSAAPICSPTRASLMTGKYPARVRLTDFIPGSNNWTNTKLLVPDYYPHYSPQGGRPGGAVVAGRHKLIVWYEKELDAKEALDAVEL